MGVEVVADDFPSRGVGVRGEQRLKVRHEIGLGPTVADGALHFAADNIESGDQGLRAVADIFELAALHLARFHRQRGGGSLQRLDARHLIDGNSAHPFRSRRRRFEIGGANARVLASKSGSGFGVSQ